MDRLAVLQRHSGINKTFVIAYFCTLPADHTAHGLSLGSQVTPGSNKKTIKYACNGAYIKNDVSV
jgi:hypothetical protein